MFRLLGTATLLLRPAVWLFLGAAFMGGILFERASAEVRCDSEGGVWRDGLCAGVAL